MRTILAALAALQLTSPAYAAFTVHNSVMVETGGTTVITAPISIPAGHTVAVYSRNWNGGSTIGVVTDSAGNAYSYGTEIGSGPGGQGSAYYIDLPSAITSVSVTPGGPGGAVLVVWDISATAPISYVDSDAVLYDFTSTTAADGITTKVMTPSGSDGLVLGFAEDLNAGALGLGTGFTATAQAHDWARSEYRATNAAAAATFTAGEEGNFILVGGLMFDAGGTLYELPADRITTWQPGVTYNGGIPSRTTVCAANANGNTLEALDYGNGTIDARSAINSAIDACPAGQVVKLSAGTFFIDGVDRGIDILKAVTLRGAGSGLDGGAETLLTRNPGNVDAVVTLGRENTHPYLNPSTPGDLSRNMTSSCVKGAYTCTVASTTSPTTLTVGQLVLISQLDTSPPVYYASDHEAAFPDGAWARDNRQVQQIMEIAAIDGTTLTFSTPFHWNFTTAQDAELTTMAQEQVNGAGLEDVHLFGGEGGDSGGGVLVEYCAYCYVKNVDSEYSSGGGVHFQKSFRSEVRDSFFHDSPNIDPGGAAYCVGFNWGTADSLIENSAMWKCNKVLVFRATGGGNVVGYNYTDDGFGSGYKMIPEIGLNAAHMTFPHMELFEGNWSWMMGSDARWGPSQYITFFRNYATGLRSNHCSLGLEDDVQNRRVTDIQVYHRNYNFVGNVLGHSGQTTTQGGGFLYEDTFPFAWPQAVTMWKLGQGDVVGTPVFYSGDNQTSTDSDVWTTMLRVKNFDYVSNELRCHDGTNGIGGNPTTTCNYDPLPNSLYIPESMWPRPFMSGYTMPWVDPEGATKVYTLPAKARFDANPPC